MFSMEAAVREQSVKLLRNAVETSVPVVLNILGGNVVRLVQLSQARWKSVPDDILSEGKLVRLEQPNQVLKKFVTDAVERVGKLAS